MLSALLPVMLSPSLLSCWPFAFCHADSGKEAEHAQEEGEKSLQEKAAEGAGRMTASIQDAYENTKAKANS